MQVVQGLLFQMLGQWGGDVYYLCGFVSHEGSTGSMGCIAGPVSGQVGSRQGVQRGRATDTTSGGGGRGGGRGGQASQGVPGSL